MPNKNDKWKLIYLGGEYSLVNTENGGTIKIHSEDPIIQCLRDLGVGDYYVRTDK